MELGETNNPNDLAPGDPGAVSALGDECGRYASCLELAGTGLQRIRTDGWTGKAADAFWERYHGEPKNWLVAADSFRTAAPSIADYASALVWAQSNAGDAIDTWNAGNLATAKARLDYTAQQRLHSHIAFDDPGELSRAAARAILAEARRQLTQAGDEAAEALAAATEPAPQERGFWDGVGDVITDMGAGLANVAGYAINGVASFGNAILHHPEGVAAMVAGVSAATAGLGGEAGGVVLDATGVGAVPGVAINVAAAGILVTGIGTALAGAGVLMNAAPSDDAVHPAGTNNPGSSANQYAPKDGFRGRCEFDQDEIEQFINGHTGDGNVGMPRPSMKQVNEVLNKGSSKPYLDHNAEEFVYKNIQVIVNYDEPWLSTASEIGG
jgi:hypothetical protein